MNELKLINLHNNKSYTITNEINQLGTSDDCILELKDNPELEAHHGILKVLFNENTIELTATSNRRIYCKTNSDSSTTNNDEDDDDTDDDCETRQNLKFIDSNEKILLKHDDYFGLLPYRLNQLEYWFKIEFNKLTTEEEKEEEAPTPSQRILPDWLMKLEKTNNETSKVNKTVKISTASTPTASSTKNTNKDSTKRNIPFDTQIESQTSSTVSTSSSSSTTKNTNKEIASPNIQLDTQDESPRGNLLNSSTIATTTSSPNINDNDESQGTIEIIPDDENLSTTQPVLRPSCEYGARCYRRNPDHKLSMAHPNDADYRSPGQQAAATTAAASPSPPNNTQSLPVCPFGIRCYRRNPVHFQEYSHPPSTNLKRNRTLHKIRTVKGQDPNNPGKRSRKPINYNSNNGGGAGAGGSDDEDDYDLDDPFINDDGSSDEYVPSNDDDSDEDDDFVVNIIETDNLDE